MKFIYYLMFFNYGSQKNLKFRNYIATYFYLFICLAI